MNGRIQFDDWSWPNTKSDIVTNAAWSARYGTPSKTDLLVLAGVVEAMHYLMVQCPTNKIALEKVRKIRRVLRGGGDAQGKDGTET